MTSSLRACALATVVLASLLPATRADADVSKAWAAAKDNLPSNTRMLLAIDVATAVKSPAYAKLFAMVMKEDKDIAQGLAVIKSTCKLDIAQVVSGLIVAADPDANQGVVYVQVTGVDRAKATTCVEAVVKVMGEKVTTAQDGAITSFAVGGDSIHVAWVAPDVVALSVEPERKVELQSWIGQKGAFAKSAVVAQLAKVDLKSIAWGGFALSKPMEENELNKVSSGYGTVTLAGGKLTANIHATFADAAAATLAVDHLKKDLVKEAGQKRTPASTKKLLKAIEVTGAGTEAVLKGTLGESEVAAAFIDAM